MSSNRGAIAGLLLASIVLSGCEDADLVGLQARLDALRNNPKGNIASLPEMPRYATASYDQQQRRSPFVAEQPAEAAAADPTEASPLPDADRPRQPLEAFELDNLSLVGTMIVGKTPSALIAAPDGRVHRLFEGDYLGRDYGRIISVESRGLTLVETVHGSGGERIERRQRLEMAAQDSDGTSRRQQ